MSGAMKATEEGSALASTTDDLGKQAFVPKFECVLSEASGVPEEIDSGEPTAVGWTRLSSAAIEAVGMYLTEDDEFLTLLRSKLVHHRSTRESEDHKNTAA